MATCRPGPLVASLLAGLLLLGFGFARVTSECGRETPGGPGQDAARA